MHVQLGTERTTAPIGRIEASQLAGWLLRSLQQCLPPAWDGSNTGQPVTDNSEGGNGMAIEPDDRAGRGQLLVGRSMDTRVRKYPAVDRQVEVDCDGQDLTARA